MGRFAKLSEGQVQEIRKKYEEGVSMAKLAEEYNVAEMSIRYRIKGKKGSVESVGMIDTELTDQKLIRFLNFNTEIFKKMLTKILIKTQNTAREASSARARAREITRDAQTAFNALHKITKNIPEQEEKQL